MRCIGFQLVSSAAGGGREMEEAQDERRQGSVSSSPSRSQQGVHSL